MSEARHLVPPSADRIGGATRTPLAVYPGSHSDGAAAPEPTRVYVYAQDSILRGGTAGQLRSSPMIVLRSSIGADPQGVAVIVADDVNNEVVAAIGGIRRSCTGRIIMVASRLTPQTAAAAFEAGTWCFLRRGDAHADRLLGAVRWAAESSGAPLELTDALGELVGHLDEDAPAAPTLPACLSGRDLEVLRLMADGWTLASIGRELSYSESTIKNVIQAIVRQLGAHNRPHAVAIALRARAI